MGILSDSHCSGSGTWRGSQLCPSHCLLASRVTLPVTLDPTRGPHHSPPSSVCKGYRVGRGPDQSRIRLSQNRGPMARSDHLPALLVPRSSAAPSVLLELASQHQSRHGGLSLAWDPRTGPLLPVDAAPPLTSQVCSFVYSKSIY